MKYTILLLLGFWASLPSIAQRSFRENISEPEKIYGLSLFWANAKYGFPFFDQITTDWDSAYISFIPKVTNTKNLREYYLVLKEFCALLRDGHTNIFLRNDITDPISLLEHPTPDLVPIYFAVIDKRYYVAKVRTGDKEAPPIGSELIEVNGIEVDSFVKSEIFPITSAGTLQERWYEAGLQIPTYGLADSFAHNILSFETPDGSRHHYRAHLKKNKAWLDEVAWTRLLYTPLEHDIAYLQINTFADAGIIEDFKAIVPEIQKAKGVILDIRNNSGGNSAIAAELLAYFTDQDLLSARSKSKNFIPQFAAYRVRELPDNFGAMTAEDQTFYKMAHAMYHNTHWYQSGPDTFRYDNSVEAIHSPMVVLIGNQTISAAEDFIVMLDQLGSRALKIGEPTFGSTGQPWFFRLPGNGTGMIVSKRDYYPNGKEFVGIGIQPDIFVKRTLPDLIHGTDRTLLKAIQYLKDQ